MMDLGLSLGPLGLGHTTWITTNRAINLALILVEGKTNFFLVGSSRSNEISGGIFLKRKLSYFISDLKSIIINSYYLIFNLKLNLKLED